MEKILDDNRRLLKKQLDGTDARLTLWQRLWSRKARRKKAKVKDLLGSYDQLQYPHLPEDVRISVWQRGKINGTVLYPGEEFSVGQTIYHWTALAVMNLQVLTRMDRPCSLMAAVYVRCQQRYTMQY